MLLFLILLIVAIIVAGLYMLRASNPVHSVLALVVVFALTALIFLLLGAEFFSILLFTVYIGAIAILFLFVIMMLDLRLAELYGSAYFHVPLGALVGLAFLGIIFSLLTLEFFPFWQESKTEGVVNLWLVSPQSNLKMLGQALYNYYIFYVFLVTLILLLAMIGVIALTLDEYHHYNNDDTKNIYRNYLWLTVQHCTKGLESYPWWEPIQPEVAARKRQIVSLQKWQK